MMNSTTQEKPVSSHCDDTDHVNMLYDYDMIDTSEIRGYAPDEKGDYPQIFQWIEFHNFTKEDYEKLVVAQIPVWFNECWIWVGITRRKKRFRKDVYPEVMKAIFWDTEDRKSQ